MSVLVVSQRLCLLLSFWTHSVAWTTRLYVAPEEESLHRFRSQTILKSSVTDWECKHVRTACTPYRMCTIRTSPYLACAWLKAQDAMRVSLEAKIVTVSMAILLSLRARRIFALHPLHIFHFFLFNHCGLHEVRYRSYGRSTTSYTEEEPL